MNNEIVFRDFAVNGGWYCNVCEQHLHPDMVPNHKHNPMTNTAHYDAKRKANPGLEQELHAVAPFDTDEPIFQELLALITQREAKAYDQGYERGRQNRFEENVKAYESGYADGLAELEKGKPDGE